MNQTDILALFEKCGAEIGRYEGEAVWVKLHKPAIEVFAAALSAPPAPIAAPAVALPAEPMDWPLPCDVTVGHGTMCKGVSLRTLVARMKVLYEMATGHAADAVAGLTIEQRMVMGDDFFASMRKSLAAPLTDAPRKQWPFVESPGEFTERLRTAISQFGDLLPAVRNVLIENPAQIKQGADGPLSELARETLLSGVEDQILTHDWRDSSSYGGEICASCGAVKGTARSMKGCAVAAPAAQAERPEPTNPDCVNQCQRPDGLICGRGCRLAAAQAERPEPMVPLSIEFEPGYPEDVAFGSQRQMDRLKKWLDKYFALITAPEPAEPVALPVVQLGEKLFSFTDFEHWRDTAQKQWRKHKVTASDTLCIDQKGRVLSWGTHFMTARDEGTFPADVYRLRADMNKAAAAKGQA